MVRRLTPLSRTSCSSCCSGSQSGSSKFEWRFSRHHRLYHGLFVKSILWEPKPIGKADIT